MNRTPLVMTPRNWINVVGVALALAAVIASRYGVDVLGYSPAEVSTAAGAFVLGLLIPGSPIGRVLDYLASFFGGPPAPPPTIADVAEVRNEIAPPPRMPVRLPPSPLASFSVFVALAVAFTVAGCAILLPGCGSSPVRMQAVIADTAGASLDEACQAVHAQRSAAQEAVATDHAAVLAIRARYAPAIASCNLVADAHDAWTDEIERAEAAAQRGEPYTLDVSLGLAVLASWPDLEALLEAEHIHLGPPDPELQAIAPDGGVS